MRNNVRLSILGLVLAGLVMLGAGAASAGGFGMGEQITTISAAMFLPDGVTNADGYASNLAAGTRWATATQDPILYAPLDSSMIPNGASIKEISFYINDVSTSADFEWKLYRGYCDADDGDNCGVELIESHTETGNPVYLVSESNLDILVVYQYDDDDAGSTQEVYNYWLAADFNGATSDVSLREVKITWERNIFPYASLSTLPDPFDDVTVGGQGANAYNCVTALWDAGVIAGCGGDNYCPSNQVSRLQMSIYVAGTLGMYWPASIPELPDY
jgi:hypothetical protein